MTKKKLIEVALPLEAINKEAAREKSIRHGHPSTLHLWWARRPLAAARAVIFAQMVDDPSAHPDRFPTEQDQERERQRLFGLIEELVRWENTSNEEVLERAGAEIRRSWALHCLGAEASRLPDSEINALLNAGKMPKLPGFHDPFAGGGALPLEAQRLGLEAYASDLNPVAVLINKAMIEIPPKFAGKPPVHPGSAGVPPALFEREWKGAEGLAEDVRYYGQWMRDEAEKRIGHLYPKVEVTAAMAEDRPDLKPYVGRKLTVIAWLWARTVKSPNPAFAHVDVPLASTFMLSTKPGKEVYVEPVILGAPRGAGILPALLADETSAPPGYRFTVKVGKPKAAEAAKNGTKLARGANFRCLMSGAPISGDYIKAEGKAGRMGARLMAIVAEGDRGRVYLAPTVEHEAAALKAQPEWKPESPLPDDPRNFWTVQYGLTTYGDLFTPRQLVALTTFSDLVGEARERVKRDSLEAHAARGADVTPAQAPGWYRRGDKHPPHYDIPQLTQFVTFRLADTLPKDKLAEWKEDLATGRISDNDYRSQVDAWLDRGMGACWLRDPAIATLVQNALRHFDGERYTLHGWVIMPNHVHVVFSPHEPHRLADILHSWKSFSAKQANRLLGRTGAFWQDDYFDRFIRDETDLAQVLTYVAYNPVVAGLCATPEHYPFAGGGVLPGNAALGDGRDAHAPMGDGPRARLETEQSGEHGGRDAHPPTTAAMGDGRPARHTPPIADDDAALNQGGSGATAYAEAVGVYLAFALSKVANIGSSIASWMSDRGAFRETFARQAIPMVWDFAEANPFADAGGSFGTALDKGAMVVEALPGTTPGIAVQADVSRQADATRVFLGARSSRAPAGETPALPVISTDPPYYDNIGYADLSDFFYVWLRRSLRPVFPDLFATMAVPKAEELVATPYRHGGKEKAEAFFLDGMTQAMHRLAEQSHPAYPVTIYYAFKQSETQGERASGPQAAGTAAPPATTSTGWETFLDAVIRAGFGISGTWPMRTEGVGRIIAKGTNALASSIVLVCRPRQSDAGIASRRDFLSALKRELPEALRHLQHGNIAPVDLAQAAIGPGMAVFSRYAKVLENDGSAMSVRTALALINQTLDEVLAEQEGEFDADTRWAVAWFDQNGFAEGPYGVAETLCTAKNTSVSGMVEAGILSAKGGKVRLLTPSELPGSAGVPPAGARDERVPKTWDPARDARLTIWEIVHRLIRALDSGETQAAQVLAAVRAVSAEKCEAARDLAYRLFTLSERRKRAQDALAYNALVTSWPEIARLAQEGSTSHPVQSRLL
ncbi:MAG: DUF1156 domain-containing protein [Pseudomonadota bacterium]